MFFDRLKRIFNRLSVRLIFGFSLVFVLSSGTLFFLVYGLFSHSLVKAGHEVIEARSKQYATLYTKEGVTGLTHLTADPKMREDAALFLVRLSDRNGQTLFFHGPVVHPHFDLAKVEQELKAPHRRSRWQTISGDEDEDAYEVLSETMIDGRILQTGKSTDAREDLLENLRDLFLAALGLTILIAAVAGNLFVGGILSSIRRLIVTIRHIQSGNIQARVAITRPGKEDEIEELSGIFNLMLNRIQALVEGMKETQDNVAHDLRTPITRFRGLAERALQKGDDVEAYKEALGEALECSDEILVLINTLMDITEAEAGAATLHVSSFSLVDLINEVVDLYAMSAEDGGIAITVTCEPTLALTADRSRVKRILSNLVDNAIKYTEGGGQIEIAAHAQVNQLVISVSDSGIGIESADLGRIWDRLYRGDRSRSKKGMGLGLNVVQSLVRAHGGQVHAESTAGEGSRFTVTFSQPPLGPPA